MKCQYCCFLITINPYVYSAGLRQAKHVLVRARLEGGGEGGSEQVRDAEGRESKQSVLHPAASCTPACSLCSPPSFARSLEDGGTVRECPLTSIVSKGREFICSLAEIFKEGSSLGHLHVSSIVVVVFFCAHPVDAG